MSFSGVSFVGNSYLPPSSAPPTHVYSGGYHLLVVNGYSRTKQDTPNGSCLRSNPFKIGGHRWTIECYPNGYEQENSDYISFYLVLDDFNVVEPVVAQYAFSFFGQVQPSESSLLLAAGARGPYRFSSTDAFSFPYLMNRQQFEKSKHLRDDSFTIRCDVAIVKNVNIGEAAAARRFVTVPPPSILHHLGNLLLSQVGADVTFQVGGEKFMAHRCVFAARSAVFRAELFGSMKEGAADTVVHIHDMDAKVFRLLLGFMYTDHVPDIEEEEEEEEEYMWQDLLVAADRYDIPRLRLICEYMMCSYIDTDTVADMLELADKHRCNGLKDACLDFLNSPPNLQQVMAAGDLDDLAISCPAVLIELIAKLTSSLKLDK
ncbi:BTB/POZ and MATH domain-containing protein 1 [Zea mays]|jgi:speckle-type POZ protein|uniref:BTB/POZ and MATH domain-containing protein 2 n=1 Tax=Zea mays TaxID=4577 RepID=A0A804LZH3_MAIZE|nr:BTB/POZ and MATH domain-containing protein 1 [Zea mays]ONM62469.1 TD and POZ domain-containing protein 4 [Zea mays]|eukprot:XP_008664937.1 BTB/POZ and MATH domain-containing protein 1 [Zea mays]